MSRIFEVLQKTGHSMPETELLFATRSETQTQTTEESIAAMVAAATPAASIVVPEPVQPTIAVKPPLAEAIPCGRTLAARLIARDPVLPFDAQSQRSMEQYRSIRTKIAHHPTAPRIVAVTSAGPGDGKTITSINIGGALSLKLGARVLLVDGDLRRSSIAKVLGLPSKPGLTDVLSNRCSLEEALIRIEQFPNYYVLPAGEMTQNPPELLDSRQWSALCESTREIFQHVIVDTPPVTAVADYELIERTMDGIVMVVRPDHTKRASFRQALSAIAPSKLIGLVLNDVEDWFLWKVENGYGYAYYGMKEEPSPARKGRTRRTSDYGQGFPGK